MTRPLLLDLFCGAGGASMGYHQAGFDVVGVDLNPQPHYPFPFVRADALTFPVRGVQAVHASPPCQAHSKLGPQWGERPPDLVTATIEKLSALDIPWVVENVPGAPFTPDLVLCGCMFGLRVNRARWFRVSFAVRPMRCHHQRGRRVVQVNGHPGGSSKRDGARHSTAEWREAMGIDWMTAAGLSQAIPPAYTEFVGGQLLAHAG